METKYKLRITVIALPKTNRSHPKRIVRSFVWEDKDDALQCKALLDKASQYDGQMECEFVEFTEEQPI